VMDSTVTFFEDHTHEFKMLKKIHMDLVSKYICAFLNSRGGTLYIGITDEGRVRGIKICREVNYILNIKRISISFNLNWIRY
jgi:predicted HTH transcriptional regulator